MADPRSASVFISYARKDAKELAHRLFEDLTARGLAVWLDTRDINAGVTWTSETERALDAAEIVLALLTGGSYVSEICRAEQLRALRHGKCVIPMKMQSAAETPLHLE